MASLASEGIAAEAFSSFKELVTETSASEGLATRAVRELRAT